MGMRSSADLISWTRPYPSSFFYESSPVSWDDLVPTSGGVWVHIEAGYSIYPTLKSYVPQYQDPLGSYYYPNTDGIGNYAYYALSSSGSKILFIVAEKVNLNPNDNYSPGIYYLASMTLGPTHCPLLNPCASGLECKSIQSNSSYVCVKKAAPPQTGRVVTAASMISIDFVFISLLALLALHNS